MDEYIKEHATEKFIIGGDFNTVLDPNIDKKNGHQGTNKHKIK